MNVETGLLKEIALLLTERGCMVTFATGDVTFNNNISAFVLDSRIHLIGYKTALNMVEEMLRYTPSRRFELRVHTLPEYAIIRSEPSIGPTKPAQILYYNNP